MLTPDRSRFAGEERGREESASPQQRKFACAAISVALGQYTKAEDANVLHRLGSYRLGNSHVCDQSTCERALSDAERALSQR